jgi:hypothetical protein
VLIPAPPRTKVLTEGERFRVVAAEYGGRWPAEDYLENEAEKPLALAALFQRMAEFGPEGIGNREHFRKLEDDLFEFKKHQDRVPCFFMKGGIAVATHGFRKKKDAVPPSEIERANRIRQYVLTGDR